jgi:hypothetical protein
MSHFSIGEIMSAFICSDKHFAVVAKALFASPTAAQQFADALKRENIKSVNHRYGESTRFRKVDMNTASPDDVNQYDGHDLMCLLACIDYQSCEHPDYDRTRIDIAERMLRAQGANQDASNKPNLWAI